MRKLFLLSAVALLSVSLFAQQKKMAEFDKSVYDFGQIVEGQGNGGRVTATFKFTNIGTTPIFIESARASCGCTTPSVDSSKPIPPGGTGEIPVTYNTIGRPGTFNKAVTITFKNAAGEKMTENIFIRGEVTAANRQETVAATPVLKVEPQKMEEAKAVEQPKAQGKAKGQTKK